MSDAICRSLRADGTPCQARPTEDGYCFAHSPALRERTAAARRAGGYGRSNAARAARHIPKDMRGLGRRLMEAIDQVHAGELDPRRASAMASLAGAVCRVYETGEIQQRIEALEVAASLSPRRGA